jgi:hypothetical protein
MNMTMTRTHFITWPWAESAKQRSTAMSQKDEEHRDDMRKMEQRKDREVEAAREEMRKAQADLSAEKAGRCSFHHGFTALGISAR